MNNVNIVTVRLDDEQYRRISESAKQNGRSIGAEIRYQLFLQEEVEE